MEFYSFARRNSQYLWAIFWAVTFLVFISIPSEWLLPFLEKNPTLVFLTISAGIAFKTYNGQRHLTCAKNTIDFQTAFHNSKELNDATTVFVDTLELMSTEGIAALAYVKGRDSEPVKSARELLNSWERVAVAIRHDVYDEEMLFRAYAGFLVNIWTTLSPYIKEKQKKKPKLFVEIEWLAIRWKIRKDAALTKRQIIELRKALKELNALTE